MYREMILFWTKQYKQEHEKCTAYTVHICLDDGEILKSSICEFCAASLWGEGLCCVGNCVPLGAELQVELSVLPLKENNSPACSTVGRKAHRYNPPNVLLLQRSY